MTHSSPEMLSDGGAATETFIGTEHIRLWESDPEVMTYVLHEDIVSGALLTTIDGALCPAFEPISGVDPQRVDVTLTVRSVVTVGGLVAASNRLLAHLDVPYRFLPLQSADDVVSCVHLSAMPVFSRLCAIDRLRCELHEEGTEPAFEPLRSVA